MNKDFIDSAFNEAIGEDIADEDVADETDSEAPEPEVATVDAEPEEGEPSATEPQEPAEEAEPSQGAVAAKEDRFTRVDVNALTPELRRLHDQMQQEFSAGIKAIGARKEDIGLAQQHAEFVRAVMNDPKLQEHIKSYWSPNAQEGKAATKSAPTAHDDDLSYFDRESQQDVQKILELAEARVSKRFEEALSRQSQELARYRGHFQEIEQQREHEELSRAYPDWDKRVDPGDLAEARKVAPHLPLASILKILDYDNMQARVGANARSEQIRKLSSRRTPPATPARRVDHEDVPTSFDDIWSSVVGGQ